MLHFKNQFLLLGLAFCLLGKTVAAQNVEKSIFEHLYSIDSLNIVLEMEAKKMMKDRASDLWYPAEMEVFRGGELVFRQSVEVKTRGKSRREICDFPPVKIRFSGTAALPDTLAETPVIKLVSTCNNTEESERIVLKEYLMYQLFNQLTDESFRVKLVSLQFKEKSNKRIYHETTAFLLEDEASLSKRLNGTIIHPKVMSPAGVDTLSMDRISVFQFMIGNTDWAVYNLHNIRVIRQAELKRVIAIPYDFDYAGAVDASYAMPGMGVPTKDVKQRYYIGLCRPEADMQRVFALFIQKRTDIMKTCDALATLPSKDRNAVSAYIGTFFDVLENPKIVQQQIVEHCNNFKK